MLVRRLHVAAMCLAVVVLPAGALAEGWSRSDPAATVYSLRGDPRMCPSPMCGGYWASRVNQKLTPCLSGPALQACYVARVDLGALTPSSAARAQAALASGRALVEGAFAGYSTTTFPQLAELTAARVWLAPTAGRETATVYRIVDTGRRCIRAPCFSIRATVVNGTRSVTLSSLDLSGTGTGPTALARAHALLSHGGVLASGRIGKPAGAGGGRIFAATRLWLPA